mgnify:CR=1 FL=1
MKNFKTFLNNLPDIETQEETNKSKRNLVTYQGGKLYMTKEQFEKEDRANGGYTIHLDKFEDERLVTFGHGLIFNEAPEILPKEICFLLTKNFVFVTASR